MNCIQEGLIDSKYFQKTTERLSQADGKKLSIKYKVPNVHICNNGFCLQTTFVLIKNLSSKVILGNPFLALLYPFIVTEKGITSKILDHEVTFPFYYPPFTKDIQALKHVSIHKEIYQLQQEKLYRKKQHLQFLQKEITYKIIEEKIQEPTCQNDYGI